MTLVSGNIKRMQIFSQSVANDDDDENRCDFWSLYYTNLN